MQRPKAVPKGYPEHIPIRPDIPLARREHRGAEVTNLHTKFDDWWEKNAGDTSIFAIAQAKRAFMDGAMATADLFVSGTTIHTIQESVRKFRRSQKPNRK